ncbi:protein-tyrosine phosphatase-like protein [Massariosphaeria phaeospora]|uniref:Protein-tyrosine phosphatase-like protein n=1 Tax=Massariosphaeria phaeospora TaxID=100035 RepID=A0A7C8IFR7_9PLEO|nr:protein-tyrosine phosphatase-like protein [Massariosphaeria phaeospora]
MAPIYSPLKSIPNFRDVGVFVNDTASTTQLKTGLLFRGARPDEASFQERQRLLHEYKIKSIIDLRTKTEHVEQAQKRDAKIKASSAVAQSNDEVAEPLKIPGIVYHEINFNGSAFSRMLISKLSWIEFFRLVFLMLAGYRLDAIKILAPHMESSGVTGLAVDSLDVCTREVKQVFQVLSDQSNWPCLVHCTQGKDRTGLVVMLVLFLLGVEIDAIEKDYLLSEPELAAERPARIKEIQSIGLSERFAMCPPDTVSTVHEHIQSKYGSVEAYLGGVGVTRAMMDSLKRILHEDAA